MSRTLRLPALALALVTVVSLGACSDKKKDDNAVTPGTSTSSSPSASSSAPDDGGGKVEVDMTDNKFAPATLTAKAGDEVELELKNKGATIHNFSLKEGSADIDIPANDEDELKFTAPAAGTYTFTCKYHVSLGMKGTLTVT